MSLDFECYRLKTKRFNTMAFKTDFFKQHSMINGFLNFTQDSHDFCKDRLIFYPHHLEIIATDYLHSYQYFCNSVIYVCNLRNLTHVMKPLVFCTHPPTQAKTTNLTSYEAVCKVSFDSPI